MPYPTGGTLPSVIITEIVASKDTTTAHDPGAMSAQLARRDLNIVPTFLPGRFFTGEYNEIAIFELLWS